MTWMQVLVIVGPRDKASGHLPLSTMKVCNNELWGDEEEMEERPLRRTSKDVTSGMFLAVQWLRFRASTAVGTGSIPGQGTKILHKKKKKM